MGEDPCSRPFLDIVSERSQELDQLDFCQSSQFVGLKEENQQVLFKSEVGGVECAIDLRSIFNSVIIDLIDEFSEIRPGQHSSHFLLLKRVCYEGYHKYRNVPVFSYSS